VKNGLEVIKDFMDTYEVKYVFGNPGTTETSFLEALTHCENTDFILCLQEASAVGLAAGYALETNKPSVINIHTYPGLANSLGNLYNALASGIPMLVIAGQQNRKIRIHNPALSGNLTGLAETATKYQYEVNQPYDLHFALQRCYSQASLPPQGPTFLSLPMDLMSSEIEGSYFKKLDTLEKVSANNMDRLISIINSTEEGKLVFIADYEVGASGAQHVLGVVAENLNADIYSGPLHVRSVVDPNHKNYKGQLSAFSAEINKTLSNYETIVLLGEKVDTFLYTGKASVPGNIRLVQISNASSHLSFDYPCDLAILGDILTSLTTLSNKLGFDLQAELTHNQTSSRVSGENAFGENASCANWQKITYRILKTLNRHTSIVTDGSSEDAVIQEMAVGLLYDNVAFSPRGGGLGWAMPVATGISLATKEHSICFVGDGGSLYAIHAIWTAAKYDIPVIYVCFINHEYKVLKTLWCLQKNTKVEETSFIGLDFNNPDIDLEKIAQGFGAQTVTLNDLKEVSSVVDKALKHNGPTFIMVDATDG
jgi:benzoylformate decarboxylase